MPSKGGVEGGILSIHGLCSLERVRVNTLFGRYQLQLPSIRGFHGSHHLDSVPHQLLLSRDSPYSLPPLDSYLATDDEYCIPRLRTPLRANGLLGSDSDHQPDDSDPSSWWGYPLLTCSRSTSAPHLG